MATHRKIQKVTIHYVQLESADKPVGCICTTRHIITEIPTVFRVESRERQSLDLQYGIWISSRKLTTLVPHTYIYFKTSSKYRQDM